MNKWIIVGVIAAVAFVAGRHSKNAPAQSGNGSNAVTAERTSTVDMTEANGQPYLNIGFNFESLLPANLSREYVPLFGFVGARATF